MSIFNRAPRPVLVADGPILNRVGASLADPTEEGFSDKYNALASKLGVAKMVPIVPRRLLPVLRKLGIAIYDLAAVEQYMDKKGTWSWFPLRESDMPETKGYAYNLSRTTERSPRQSSDRLYDKPVPYPVLLTVEALNQKFQGDIRFLVAALDSKPDPFLACWLASERNGHGLNLTVIERWDEPSFRGSK